MEHVLGRRERPVDIRPGIASSARVLITGARGSIGSAICDALEGHPHVVATDIDDLDVTDESRVAAAMRDHKPDVVFHMAAAKSAGDGESDPWLTAQINVLGTQNVLRFVQPGAVVVVASTCKACAPETAYGATKLIAERLTLNAGQRVARFYNVVESSGNVFRSWDALTQEEPVPWTACFRYFISLREAVSLALAAACRPPGRYAFDPGEPRAMRDVAADYFPGRELVEIPRRRGDRIREPLIGSEENRYPISRRLVGIVGMHDPGTATGGLL